MLNFENNFWIAHKTETNTTNFGTGVDAVIALLGTHGNVRRFTTVQNSFAYSPSTLVIFFFLN